MKNPNNITNPKTLRRYQRNKERFDKLEKFAKENGYLVEHRGNSIYSFSQNGVRSVLGFDSESEVLQFIFDYQPDPTKIVIPYK